MKKKLSKYFAFAKGSILSTFAYKFSIFGWVVGDVIEMIVVCFLWIAIFKYSPNAEINGFTKSSMLVYLIYARIVAQLVYASESFWIIGEDIREGNIANNLIRPISYRNRLVASDIGSYIGRLIMTFLPIFVISIVILHFTVGSSFPTWYNVIFFLISSLASLLIVSSFEFMLGQLAFFTGALFGIGIMKNALLMFLSGGSIPLAFFPESIQKIFRFLPFSSMLETPNFIVMGKYSISETLIKIAIQVFWIIIMSAFAEIVYRLSSKHITSVGG